jgi:hypothetical protein
VVDFDDLGDADGAITTAGETFYGKYRGTVVDVADPLMMGRLRAFVPEVLGEAMSGWALPCAPFTGWQAGLYAVPSVGANVWIEFEAGDPSRPVWVGGWWTAPEVPVPAPAGVPAPITRVLRSDGGLVITIDDATQTISVSDALAINAVTINVLTQTVTLQGGVRAVVDAPQVQLGGELATHPQVHGELLTTWLNQLYTAYVTHMHPGQANAGGPVSPAPPTPGLSPPPPMVSAQVFHA